MSDIILGQLEGDGALRVDVPVLVDTRALITGNSGAGKSRLLRRLAEQAFGKVQIIILDPEGEFATLRERHDFLLAGRGGEVPASPPAAALLAKRLMELRVSAVLDLYELKLHERRGFVRLFLDALVEMPRDLYRPVLVLVDEAHLFCPEKSAGEAESTGSVIELMTRGRKRGLAGILATQRLSKLHKDAAAEAKNVFVGGITLDVDQKRAADSLGLSGRDERIGLRDIRPGVFLAYGPALSARGVSTFTAGEIHTTHPKAGQRHKVEAPAPPEAIRKLTDELKDLPQQAAEEIRTLQAAKARVRDLERELRARPKEKVEREKVVTKTVDRPVLKDAQVKRLEGLLARMEKVATGVQAAAAVVDAQGREIKAALAAARAQQEVRHEAPVTSGGGGPGHGTRRPTPVAPRAPAPPRALAGNEDGRLPVGEQATLTAVAQQPRGANREQLSVLTGYKRSSRDAYVGRLVARGYVVIDRGLVVATAEGLAALGPDFEPLPTGDALREHWMGRLPEGEKRVLGVLVDAYPEPVHRERIDEAVGYQRSSRDAYIQRLKARRLVVVEGPGTVRATDDLFGGLNAR